MSVYQEYILPHLINCACGNKAIKKQREKVVPLAHGAVLEIGVGSGLNLPFYRNDQVSKIWGLEPSSGMRNKAAANLRQTQIPFEWLEAHSESIPLPDGSVDCVVLTYTLCTIAHPITALNEMRRVLKADGLLLLSEHGLAAEVHIAAWQQRLNFVWKKVAGGCNLNRDIAALVHSAGFTLDKIEQGYVPGPKVACYHYWGRASLS